MAVTLEEIGRPVEAELREVRRVIEEYVAGQPRAVEESLRYYFSSGGKFLRPLLTLLSARVAAGGELGPERAREAVLFAAAVEFVHNASLVHDDIMDGDRFRRNLQTLHEKYGQTFAVLLGDILHITVFDLLGRIGNPAAIGMMTGSIREMCYGQLLDVRTAPRTTADYARIVRCKTGKLMATACAGGALMSGAPPDGGAVRALGRFGMYAGVLYQMVDDCRDGDGGVTLTPDVIARVARKAGSYLDPLGDTGSRRRLYEFVEYVAAAVIGNGGEAGGRTDAEAVCASVR